MPATESIGEPNPLLEDWALPPFRRIRPEHAVPALERALADAHAVLARARGLERPAYGDLVEPLELAEERLERIFSPVEHLNAVASTPHWREAYQRCLAMITEYRTATGQDEALYRQFHRLADSGDFHGLAPDERKNVRDTLRDFRLSGVDLPAADKQRFAEIQQRLSQLGARFEENVMDAADAWSLHFTDADRLTGLPADIVGRARARARDAGEHGWRFALDAPTQVAVLHHARDRELRYSFYRAWMTRASDQDPHQGRFDNGPLMEEFLALRHESARLTGFEHYAACSLATKMAPGLDAVESFLAELAERARPRAKRELAGIARLARELGGPDELAPWDLAYYGERLKERRYGVSEDELRPYFPLPGVLDGLFSVAERLFGVRIREREGVEAWHPDVRFFELLEGGDEPVAGFYLDAYARPAKRSGAWMSRCTGRLVRAGRRQLPVAHLTLNANPPGDGMPALMVHDEVVTLFHEFGHGLHHMLTRVDVPSLAGIEGVEWDAVELPSQFLENWCWRRESLDRFARRFDDGEPMPETLFERLSKSRRHMAGLTLVRQLEFALFDLRLHAAYDPARGARIQETLDEVRAEVAVVTPPPWNRFAHSFTHIFGDAYAAGYYSYLWAEVLAADAFSLFEQRGVFDPATGRAFREEILAAGGSRPAMESFRAFRGREPQIEPLLEQYGIAA